MCVYVSSITSDYPLYCQIKILLKNTLSLLPSQLLYYGATSSKYPRDSFNSNDSQI